MEKREPSYTVGGNVNWCRTMEISMEVSSKTKNRAINDPVIPLLDTYQKKAMV